MTAVAGAYCDTDDLRTGDIPFPSSTTPAQYVSGAAEEIDAALGHIYVTPIVIDPIPPENRPATLYLKKINWLLASGRMLSDAAAAGEETALNAYAKRMLDEACEMLDFLKSQKYIMVGAPLLGADDPDKAETPTGPMIANEDPFSLVETFYRTQRPSPFYLPPIPPMYPPVVPYDTEVTSG